MVVLIVKDRLTPDSKLRFSSADKAAEHARMVIVPQILEELEEIAQQDDPSEFMDRFKELKEIAQELFETDEERVREAIEDWTSHAEQIHGSMWIEWV